MEPAKYTLKCKRGTTFRKTFSFYDEDPDTEVRTPLDFTGYEGRMQVRVDFDSANFIVNLTTGNSGITITGNEVELYISDDVTEGFNPGIYKYDLELEIGGEVICPLYGSFKVADEITREDDLIS